MSGKACVQCFRGDCDRCTSATCVCCGAGSLFMPEVAYEDLEWHERDGPAVF